MPELPEVETIRRGIAPHLIGQIVQRVVVREPRLRWPIPSDIHARLSQQTILRVERRAKYLLLRTQPGTVLLHLGMSGTLRILPLEAPVSKHDHLDIELDGGHCLRFNDPRRFGSLLWSDEPVEHHPLLRHLGPEPFSDELTAAYLYRLSQGRRTAVKSMIMNNRIVVGIGNIYASEALFLAGIQPLRAVGKISRLRYDGLVEAIREVLSEAIRQGGTTLRDFKDGSGRPGYFQHALRVYGRDRQPCLRCGKPIRLSRLGQRATYHCPNCQH